MFYHPIFEDFDSRILEYSDDMQREPNDKDTYEEARQAVADYLKNVIGACRRTLKEFEKIQNGKNEEIWEKLESLTAVLNDAVKQKSLNGLETVNEELEFAIAKLTGVPNTAAGHYC